METRQLLEEMPGLVARLCAGVDPEGTRRRPDGQPFSLVEHAWHLADLEREGFGVRVHRLLTEEDPALPDFPGDRIAEERHYREADLTLGLQLFAHARARTLAMLDAATPAERLRTGRQEGVGPVMLGELAARIAAHDVAHLRELCELLEAVAPEHPELEALKARLADAKAA